ncbi:hypothetical protein CDQ74_00990 [Campylobacter hyointestinalis subsp. hyointestinalis]|nr:hypothetical protein CDQ74_00990 [Campylobacter hyointestinalis subsp. hyointestinalis]
MALLSNFSSFRAFDYKPFGYQRLIVAILIPNFAFKLIINSFFYKYSHLKNLINKKYILNSDIFLFY